MKSIARNTVNLAQATHRSFRVALVAMVQYVCAAVTSPSTATMASMIIIMPFRGCR